MPKIYSKPADKDNPANKENASPVECELKIRKITLLANTKDEFIKSFPINLPTDKIDKKFNKDLLKAIKANKGKKMLSINVLDYEHQIAVEFFSRKYKIDVTPEFIDFVEHYNLNYKVETQVHL